MYSRAKWGISNEPIRNPFFKKPKFSLLTILPIFPSSQMKVIRVSQESFPRGKYEINLCLKTLLSLPLNLSSYYTVFPTEKTTFASSSSWPYDIKMLLLLTLKSQWNISPAKWVCSGTTALPAGTCNHCRPNASPLKWRKFFYRGGKEVWGLLQSSSCCAWRATDSARKLPLWPPCFILNEVSVY